MVFKSSPIRSRSFISTLLFTCLLSTSLHTCIKAQESDFKSYKAHNGIQFEYTVLLPKNFEKNKAYETIIAFAGMEPKDDQAEWSINHLWQNHKNYPYIVVIPKVPLGQKHWISHPIHHGLNNFLEFLKKTYNVKNKKFHFVGYRLGCIPAQTYITMLNYPPASLTLFSSDYWDHYNKSTYDELTALNIPVNLFFRSEDKNAHQVKKVVFAELEARGTKVVYELIDAPGSKLDELLSD